MRADSLEKQLQNRPKPDELIKEGILEGAHLLPPSICMQADILIVKFTENENPLNDD
jgi:hypothetical protein